MAFPARLQDLPDYAFPRPRRLLGAHRPGGPVAAASVGEPTQPQPPFAGEVAAESLDGLGADLGRDAGIDSIGQGRIRDAPVAPVTEVGRRLAAIRHTLEH